MQSFPVIALPWGTRQVRTSEIPDLIANTLHPELSADSPRMITALYRTAKTAERWSGWPIEDADREVLNGIFCDLPKFVIPIQEKDWAPYATAFKERGQRLDWVLNVRLSDPHSEAALCRHAAKDEHSKNIEQSIRRGELIQLDPTTRIPTATYLENGIVPITALEEYLSRFAISLVIADEGQGNVSAEGTARNTATSSRPQQRQPWQEDEIIRVIRELGFDPASIPKVPPGRSGVKSQVRKKLGFSDSAFDKAWERLRNDGRISNSQS